MRTAARFALFVLLGMAPLANAAAPKVDVSNDSIHCDTIIGTVGIKPALNFAGGAVPVVASIKGTVDGCTVSGPNAATILSGSFSGKLNGNNSNCTTLFGTSPLAGTLVFKWKADPTTPLLQGSSTVTVGTLTGSTYSPGAPLTGTYGLLSLGITQVQGAFTGGDNGATSTSDITSGQSVPALAADCAVPLPKGISKINTGIGEFTLQ